MCTLQGAHLDVMWEPRPVCCVQHSATGSLLVGLLQVLHEVMIAMHQLLGQLETSKGVAWLPLSKDCMDQARRKAVDALTAHPASKCCQDAGVAV